MSDGEVSLSAEELAFQVLDKSYPNFFDPEDEQYDTSAVVVDEYGRGSAGVDIENTNYTTGFWALTNAVHEGLQNGGRKFSDAVIVTEDPDYRLRGTDLESLYGFIDVEMSLKVCNTALDEKMFYRVVERDEDDAVIPHIDEGVEVVDESFEPYSSYLELDTDRSKEEVERELIDIAEQGMEKAYADDSGFEVGSALMTFDGIVYPYSNKEHEDDRKLTAHSEDVFAKAVRYGEEPGDFDKIVIATSTPEGGSSCGNCLQTMAEFQDISRGHEDLDLVFAGQEDVMRRKLSEDFPLPFSPGNL
ncbi:MAG: hypothetical protein BRC29_00650 [Nanohaloarchaea archaeon SW_7_43_1]|nr:MAG: hypothetical protein BRC29_00650 [Nanohaloarchaea archaeon SW_7_43_1]